MAVTLLHLDSGHFNHETITPSLSNNIISFKCRTAMKCDSHLQFLSALPRTYRYKHAVSNPNEDNDGIRRKVNDATYAHIQFIQNPYEYGDQNCRYHCHGTNDNHLVNFDGWTLTKTNAPRHQSKLHHEYLYHQSSASNQITSFILILFICCIGIGSIGSKMRVTLLLSLHFTSNSALVIATGPNAYHNCAIYINKTKCWGMNKYGQLGYGDTDNRGDKANEMSDDLLEIDLGTNFLPTEVVTAFERTCALAIPNKIKCWGSNTAGIIIEEMKQILGYGDTNNRGDEANEMGDDLLDIDLGTNF
eukprot:290649_1